MWYIRRFKILHEHQQNEPYIVDSIWYIRIIMEEEEQINANSTLPNIILYITRLLKSKTSLLNDSYSMMKQGFNKLI